MPLTLCAIKASKGFHLSLMNELLLALSRQRSAISAFLLCSLFLLLTACDTSQPPIVPLSAWGEIRTLAQAEQSSAPALYVSSQGIVTAAWVGADDTGIHHDMRQGTGETVILPLPPVHPYAQSLHPSAFDETTHLLWLDADYQLRNDPLTANTQYLYAALINSAQTVERGPTRISSRLTLHYTAVTSVDGGLWVAWSGGLPAEPELYTQRIDNAGRPLQPQRLAINADFPAIVRAEDGTLLLFWTQPTSGTVYRARLVEGIAQDITTISSSPVLNAGDRLVNVSASLDTTHAYLFWNIARADGHPETWWTSGAVEAEEWSLPQRLGIATMDEPFVTGFNGGAGIAASAGETWLSWAAPMIGQYDMLPVGVYDGAQLGVVYLQGGAVVGYQAVVAVDLLIGTPTLMSDRDRHLYLSWSYPTPAGYADLLLTSTRR